MDHPESKNARTPAPPQIPKHMRPNESLGAPLEDDAEYTGLLVVNGDMSESAAHHVTFSQMQFQRCRWQQTRLTAATMRDVRFTVCDVSQGEWDESFVWRGELIESRLLGWRAAKAHLRDVRFTECNANYAMLPAAKCETVRFERCLLQHASFVDADLRGAVFDRCDLTEANLHGANLMGADLRGSVLEGIRVGVKELRGAIVDFQQAAVLVQMLGVVVKLD
jgi:uncharacterized protein YjbI with pentapeptide repeats